MRHWRTRRPFKTLPIFAKHKWGVVEGPSRQYPSVTGFAGATSPFVLWKNGEDLSQALPFNSSPLSVTTCSRLVAPGVPNGTPAITISLEPASPKP
jgi:hypothetical protein